MPRRDQLLEAAFAVISQKGFNETSMWDIARQAGVSRATVYLHFRDRRDILVALAERVGRRMIDAVDAWPALPDPASLPTGPDGVPLGREVLVGMIQARLARVFSTMLENADAARMVLRVTGGKDDIVNSVLRRVDDHVVGVLARDIEAALRYGWVRPCDPAVVARFVLGGIERLTIGAIDRDEGLDVERVTRETAAFVLGGLSRRRAEGGTRPPSPDPADG